MTTGIIKMEDRECSPEELRELYVNQGKTKKYIKSKFNVTEGVVNRWFKESNIKSRGKGNSLYTMNYNSFDIIDTEEKAYWLGFLWCDGYVLDRQRNGKRSEISIKMQLARIDECHIYKFRDFLSSNHPIAQYTDKSFGKLHDNSRLMFSNMHMGITLIEKYGLVPHRYSIKKLKENIPHILLRHFIRGVYDAEGSLSVYYNRGVHLKAAVCITTYLEMNTWIQEEGWQENILRSKTKFSKRHIEGDGHAVSLDISGTQQSKDFLDWLYRDATVFLERKHNKYKELINILTERG